jgi:hypothetical protein
MLPDIVATDVFEDVYDTVNPELDVDVKLKGGSPYIFDSIELNVIV